MSMVQLVAAGAPELPAGYFYRVRPSSMRLLKVELRQQGRFFSSLVEDTYICPGEYPTAEEAVVAACRRVVGWWREKKADAEALEASRAWHGDHDPKGGK
ncbi:hypothetical protein AB0E81_11280 [Streptomyces sp. NPDC033538]|uniref:hypothetical protein n=1 Tax=Streptomyces sp. NPDC033538 TaxID=3155367 RepID=UPI0033F22342